MMELPDLSSVPNERPGGRRFSMTVLSMAKRALGIGLNVGEGA